MARRTHRNTRCRTLHSVTLCIKDDGRRSQQIEGKEEGARRRRKRRETENGRRSTPLTFIDIHCFFLFPTTLGNLHYGIQHQLGHSVYSSVPDLRSRYLGLGLGIMWSHGANGANGVPSSYVTHGRGCKSRLSS